MSKPFDYSKWDNIELSDDEEDVHPNIERESWFRMKHRARVEREEKEEIDKKKIRSEVQSTDIRIKEIQTLLQKLETSSDSEDELEDTEGLQAELTELHKTRAACEKKLADYEKHKKWNVDNMCHVAEERTVINPKAAEQKFSASSGFALPEDEDELKVEEVEKPVRPTASSSTGTKSASSTSSPSQKKASTAQPTKPVPRPKPAPTAAPPKPKAEPKPAHETVAMLSYHDFIEKYADLLEEFMTLRDLDQSKEFLIQHGNVLLQENASNYLLLASLEDEMNGFHDKMKLTARQSQILSNIAELAKSLKHHPGTVIMPFFNRMNQREFFEGFMEGVDSFISKIEKRAVQKKKEMAVEEENVKEVDLETVPVEERLGPGGLDPVEVFKSLPVKMQEAFESRDVEQLKRALMELETSDAEYHMKRCVDSGLWNEG